MPTCKLCQQVRPLRGSHIIPAFVYRWFKDTSATGYIRTVERPNLRVQDGPAAPLLCGACEQRLATLEKRFSELIFQPCAQGAAFDHNYGPWLAEFAASVCWRALIWAAGTGRVPHYYRSHRADVIAALEMWRTFLLAPDLPGGNPDVHFLPIGPIHGISGVGVPPNMHQYLLRVIDVEVVTGGEQSHFIYVKLGPVIFFGFIRPAPDGVWEGTAILPRGGRLPETYALPETLFQFMCDRARLVLKAQESISPKQGQKIASEWRRDPDRAAWSGTIEALRADVETFGRGPVFGVRQDPKSSGDGPPDSRSEP